MTSTSTPAPPLRWQGPDGVVIVGEERYRRLDGPIYYSGPVRPETPLESAQRRLSHLAGDLTFTVTAQLDLGTAELQRIISAVEQMSAGMYALRGNLRGLDGSARIMTAAAIQYMREEERQQLVQRARRTDDEVMRMLAGTRPICIAAGSVGAPPATEGENSAQLPGISLAAPIVPIKHAKKAAAQWKNELTRIRKGGR